jgi:hypothetical protein
VSWDLKYQPLGEGGGGRGGGGAGGAVPHRTYPSVNAPWAPPGNYIVRLTVGGKTFNQPLTLKLDPRVKTPALGLTTLTTLTREMYNGAKAARDAAAQARALAADLDRAQGDDVAKLKAEIAALAPPVAANAGGRGRGRGGVPALAQGAEAGRGGNTSTAPTLDTVSAQMLNAAMAMQAADVAPTGREVAACAAARRQSAEVMARWNRVKAAAQAAIARR